MNGLYVTSGTAEVTVELQICLHHSKQHNFSCGKNSHMLSTVHQCNDEEHHALRHQARSAGLSRVSL